jgi:hypothetical protein
MALGSGAAVLPTFICAFTLPSNATLKKNIDINNFFIAVILIAAIIISCRFYVCYLAVIPLFKI